VDFNPCRIRPQDLAGKRRNINVSGKRKIAGYAGPVEYGRGGSRKSPDSFSGASPPASPAQYNFTSYAPLSPHFTAATNSIKKGLLTLPVLALIVGIAIAASCSTGNEIDNGKTGGAAGGQEQDKLCSTTMPYICTAKNMIIYKRLTDEQQRRCNNAPGGCNHKSIHINTVQHEFRKGVFYSHGHRRGTRTTHEIVVEDLDPWIKATGIPYCFNDADREFGERLAEEAFIH
jgi:hypothetical protein